MDLQQTHAEQASPPRASHTLASLAAMSVDELGRLYARGAAPAAVAALDGHPRGRMLAVRGLDAGLAADTLRRLSGAAAFPWGGKSFTSRDARSGAGVNRVHLGGRHQLFPFLTRLEASVVDGQPALVLDYDLPDNPGLIRAIHDEVREVSPGLYLGPAMWKAAAGPTLVLWFALDTRDQQKPVGWRSTF